MQREVIGDVVGGWLSFGRLVRRTVSGAITREPRCNGNVESAWAAGEEGPEALLFRRPRELEAWLETLEPAG